MLSPLFFTSFSQPLFLSTRSSKHEARATAWRTRPCLPAARSTSSYVFQTGPAAARNDPSSAVLLSASVGAIALSSSPPAPWTATSPPASPGQPVASGSGPLRQRDILQEASQRRCQGELPSSFPYRPLVRGQPPFQLYSIFEL